MNGTDQELLQRYTRERADDAFAELVRRHLNLVYSAALRQLRSPQLAEEVAQSVFLDFARQATRLKPGTVLTAWLYQVTRRTAIDVVRREARRQSREQTAVELNAMNSTPADWDLIGPLLDDALETLDETDRTAILLRFFENKSLRDVGAALGASDDAAQKRVSRAVERLREYFIKRGVPLATGSLVIAVSANAVQAAPIGLAATISSGAALAAAVVPASNLAVQTIAMTTLQKTLVATSVALLAGIGIYQAQQAAQLRHQVQDLRAQQAPLAQQIQQLQRERDDARQRVARTVKSTPRLPAPRMAATVPTAQDLQATNLYQRLVDKHPKLTAEQAAAYLQANGRTAASLLAAFRTTGDPALLAEAMQKYPDDARVAFEAALRKDAAPEEKRQWLEALKKSDPGNALANYLSALDYFKTGSTDQAVQELLAASGKSFQDYTIERYQDDAEAYLAAGYSVADAKTTSGSELMLPQLSQMKELGLDLIELAKTYTQSGDSASAQAVLQIALGLGQNYSSPSPGEPTVSQLVGIYIERAALEAMNPNSPYGASGQTVQDRLNQLAQQRTDLMERNRQAEAIFPQMTDQDWINYRDRWLLFGEENAIRWLVSKYGQPLN